MGLNPCVEGQGQVRVPLPKVTKESRDALVKVAAKHTEKVGDLPGALTRNAAGNALDR